MHLKVADTERGEWLRQHGLHSEHLALYEQELEGILTDKQLDLKRENAELKKHIKELERELAHNQKAMAEALALLTLKKNHQRYFTQTRRTNRVGAENTGSGAHRRGGGKRWPGEKSMRSPRHLHKKLHTLESRYDGRQTQGGGKIGAAKAFPRRSRTVLSGSQHSRILQPDTCSDCCISFGAGHLLRQPAHSLVHPKGKISSPLPN